MVREKKIIKMSKKKIKNSWFNKYKKFNWKIFYKKICKMIKNKKYLVKSNFDYLSTNILKNYEK